MFSTCTTHVRFFLYLHTFSCIAAFNFTEVCGWHHVTEVMIQVVMNTSTAIVELAAELANTRGTRISTALRSNLAFRNHYLCRALVADNSLFSRVHPQAPVQVVSIHRLPLSHSARLSSRPHDFATSLCPSTLLSRSRRITSALLPLARRVAPVASRLRLCTALRTVTHQFEACPKS